MEQKWLYGIIGLLAGTLITIVVASNSVNSSNFGMMQMMGMRQMGIQNIGSGGVMGNIDRHFIEQMIPHHEDAITMANIALEKATHPEIKTLAEDIIKAQSDEITTMKGWYKDWFGTDVPESNISTGMRMTGRMHGGMMGDET